jgi:hypothetical protein
MRKFGLLCAAAATLSLIGCGKSRTQTPAPDEVPVVNQPLEAIDDSVWIGLDRRNVTHYREQLKAAPPALIVRESHYSFNSTNGMGMHYGWLDGKIANLGISVSELVGYGYNDSASFDERQLTRTEFPPNRGVNGYMTNTYDVIVTITNHPQEAMQAEIKKLLRQQFGLAWHRENRNTSVLLIKVKDPKVLQSKIVSIPPGGSLRNRRLQEKALTHSMFISELAGDLENFFDIPVIDETGATNRYDRAMQEMPSRWVNGRTTDLDANNRFLAPFGLELVPDKRPQEWLAMDPVK